MNDLQNTIPDFSKKQLKYITRISVALMIIYQALCIMTDFNTDFSDGFFILLPVFLAICVKIKIGFFCYIPLFLVKTYLFLLQVVGLIANKNLQAKNNIHINIMPRLYSVVLEFCTIVIPVLIVLILLAILKNKIFKKTAQNKNLSTIIMTILMIVSSVLVIALMQSTMVFVINNLLKNLFAPYSVNFSAPLMISFECATGLFTILTALFFNFRNKICKE